MHIETALNLSSTSQKKQASQMQIHQGLAYLRASSEHWESARCTLRMLEVIVDKTGLTLGGLNHHEFDLSSMSPFTPKENRVSDERLDSGADIVGGDGISVGQRPLLNDAGYGWAGFPDPYKISGRPMSI